MFKYTNARYVTVCLLLLCCTTAFAQISQPIVPISLQQEDLKIRKNIPQKTLPIIDLQRIQQEDRIDEAAGLAPRFGYPLDVDFNLKNVGSWTELDNGDRVWQLTIRAEGAKSINLLYEDFFLPEGAHLHLYNDETGHTIGAFTSLNNKYDGRFATGLVYGEKTTLEYYEPAAVQGVGRLNISTVVHGYRYIPGPKGLVEYEDSGSCNVNTICTQGDNWRDEIKAIGLMLIDGTRWCSGGLYGNADGDCTAHYVTANHCLGPYSDALLAPSATNISFIWRYESPSCANGGTNNDGPTTLTTVGATIVANNGNPGQIEGTDFAVMRLIENPVDAKHCSRKMVTSYILMAIPALLFQKPFIRLSMTAIIV
ncbi:MAG: hypothetical protein AAF738_09070 [Bacteroidota bacterium]